MIEPTFIDDENVPLIGDNDYEETSFIAPPGESLGDQPSFGTPHFSNSRIAVQQLEIKRQKIATLYKHLGAHGDPNLADLDKFRMRRNEKSGKIMVEFYKDGDWVKLTKITVNFTRHRLCLSKIGVNLFHSLNLSKKHRLNGEKLHKNYKM